MHCVEGKTRTIDDSNLICRDCSFRVMIGTTKIESLKRSARRHVEKTGHKVDVIYQRIFTASVIDD